MSIQRLPKQISSSILSSSSIYSQVSAIKELIENSIDALRSKVEEPSFQAQISIEIDDSTAGLERILVKDNGIGVLKNDRPIMCLNCTTSKLTTLQDLEEGIKTCGFRGEALHFICRASNKVEITTRCEKDALCETWEVNSSGLPVGNPKKSSGQCGTTFIVMGLFKNTPVRKKFLKKERKKNIAAISEMVSSYSLIYRAIRFQLKYVKVLPNGNIVNAGDNITLASKISRVNLMCNIMKLRDPNKLFEINDFMELSINEIDLYKVEVYGIFHGTRAQDIIYSKHNIKVLDINDRPMNLKLKFGKSVLKIVNESFSENMLISPQIWFLSLKIPVDKVDVNIEPEKSDVMISHEDILLQKLKELLISHVMNEQSEDKIINKMTSDRVGSIAYDLHKKETEETSEVNNVPDENNSTALSEGAQLFVGDEDDASDDDEQLLLELGRRAKELKKQIKESDQYDLPDDSLDVTQEMPFVPTSGNGLKNKPLELPEFSKQRQHEKNAKTTKDNGPMKEKNNLYDCSFPIFDNTSTPPECDSVLVQDLTSLNTPETTQESLASKTNSNISNLRAISKMRNDTRVLRNDAEHVLPSPDSSFMKTQTQTQVNLTNVSPIKPKTLSSHITHHILEKPTVRKQRSLNFQRVPVIAEMTQKTFSYHSVVHFELASEIIYRKRIIEEEEKWTKRTKNPSVNIVEGATELLTSYGIINDVDTLKPFLGNDGIYKLV